MNTIGDEMNQVEHFVGRFHNSKIQDMAITEKKPFFVTCQTDGEVKILNYNDFNTENTVSYQQVPLQVAFHPNGHYLAISFTEIILLISIQTNCFKTFKEIKFKNSI